MTSPVPKADGHFWHSLLCLILILFSLQGSAQYAIRGMVSEASGKPLHNASVVLIRASDSSLIKGNMTSVQGQYSFNKIVPGSYLISATYVGYRQVFSSVLQLHSQNIEVAELKLMEKTGDLSGVTISRRKPLVEQTIDRLVINVAGNITSSGSTALDVLERSPGVIVDRQNNSLSINGKDGVVVMMNGKISHMPIASVVQMLAGIPADNIEKIELITTPPASLDAEGNAGYINIVVKQNMQYGTNGSYSLTGGYSKGEIIEGSINFNHRKNKVNIYGDYSYTRTHIHQPWAYYHAVTNGADYVEDFATSARKGLEAYHNAKLGLDYDLNKKTIIGALFTLYMHRWTMDADNESKIYTNQVLDTNVSLLVHEFHPTTSLDMNFNIQHSYNEAQKLILNLDYMHYIDINPSTYNNNYYKGDGTFLYGQQLKSEKTTPIGVGVVALDYTLKLNKKIGIESGLKGTFSHFNNDVKIEQLQNNTWTDYNNLSAKYNLNENISAAYTSANWTINLKTSMKFGLRYEYTNTHLGTAKDPDIVNRHFGNLFPSFFFSHTLNDQQSLNFSYSKRVTRPTFWNLAPFLIFVDPNTFFSGNPGLLPSITDNVNLGYTYKKKLLSVAYSFEADPITNFSPKVDPKTNIETLAAENQINRKSVTISLSLPIDITPWWNLQANLNGQYQELHGLYNTEPVNLNSKTFFFNATQNIKLPKEYSFSVSGFYRSAGIWGIYNFNAIGSLDAGVQKKLANKKSTLRFNVGNILNSIKLKPEVNLPEKNLVARHELQFTSTTFRLTFTHSFGNDKLKDKRNRSSGTEEEKIRLEQ